MRDLWKLYRELFRFNWLYFWHTLKKCWFVYFRSRKCHQIRQKQTTHEEAHTCHLWGMIKQFPFFFYFPFCTRMAQKTVWKRRRVYENVQLQVHCEWEWGSSLQWVHSVYYTRNSETIRENNNGLIHGEEKRPYMSKLDEKHRWRVCHFAWMQYHFFRSRKRWRLEATWIKQRDNGHDNDFIERKWKSESGKVQRCTTMR